MLMQRRAASPTLGPKGGGDGLHDVDGRGQEERGADEGPGKSPGWSPRSTTHRSRSASVFPGVVHEGRVLTVPNPTNWHDPFDLAGDLGQRTGVGEPLLYRSRFLRGPMRRARVTEDEVRQAARASGEASVDDVAAVVPETDGSFSVLSTVPDLTPERRERS
jgi:hypothetical protein